MRAALHRRRLLLLLATLGCETHLVDPALPSSATTFDAPAIYATWWNLTQACSGISRPLGAISWYVVPGETIPSTDPKRQNLAGYWSAASNRIVLASSAMLDGKIVRHEMLHALSRAPGHPRDLFLEKCDGVVDCASSCVQDAGAAPSWPADVLRIPVEHLQVAVDFEPSTPSVGKDGGFFIVRVTATNPSDEPVVAELVGHSVTTFAYAIQRLDGSVVQSEQELREPADLRFDSRQTKQRLFDVRAGGTTSHGFPPGTYTVTGRFGLSFATTTFQISP